MGEYKSKYSLSERVKFVIQDTIFLGKIAGITFVESGTYYDIEVSGNIYKSIAENALEK